MLKLRDAKNWVKGLLSEPTEEMSRWRRTAKYSVELGVHCAKELKHDRATQMAAALTYQTLLSLLPMIVLALITLHSFVDAERQQEFKNMVISWALRPLAEQESGDGGTGQGIEIQQGETSGGVGTEAGHELNRRMEFEQASQSIGQQIQMIFDKLGETNLKSIGVVGVLFFIYAATALLVTIERNFNFIFGIRRVRPWYFRIPIYYTMITLGPLVLLAGLYIQQRLLHWLEAGSWTNWLSALIVMASPLLSSWLVLFVMYILIPNTRVGKRMAGIGSFVAALLWVTGVELFTLFVQHTGTSSLYGALALVPIFMMWMWLNWLIVLFGLEVTFTLSAMRGKRMPQLISKQVGQILIDTTAIVPLMIEVAKGFEKGEQRTLEDLRDVVNLPDWAVHRMLEALEGAGLIRRGDSKGEEGYSLARPAESVQISELLLVGERMTQQFKGRGESRLWQFPRELRARVRERLGGLSLGDVSGSDNPGELVR